METFGYSEDSRVEDERIVRDLGNDLAASVSVDTYIHDLESRFRETESFSKIVKTLGKRANEAFRINYEEYRTAYSTHTLARIFSAIPALYLSRPFKHGVALGMAANQKVLGSDMDNALTPYIDSAMELPGLNYREYAYEIETLGQQTYNLGMSGHTLSLLQTDIPLRNFTERVGDSAYDDIRHLTYFKSGVGMARYAYNGYINNMNQQFRDVVVNGIGDS